jgi:hypothetical protein
MRAFASAPSDASDSPGKSQSRAFSCLYGLILPIPRWCIRLKRVEEFSGDCRYLVNGSNERGFVRLRWLIEAADFSHELQGGRTNLILGHRRREIEENLDISTHGHGLDVLVTNETIYAARRDVGSPSAHETRASGLNDRACRVIEYQPH